MNILSLDPGSVQTGYAFDDSAARIHSGVLKAPQGWARWKRIASIRDQLRDLIRKDNRTAGFDAIVIEIPGNKAYARNRGRAHKNIHAISVIGMVIGALALEARDNGLEVYEADAAEWTCSVDKDTRKLIASQDSGRKITNDNEADAIVLLRWFRTVGEKEAS